MNAIQTTIAVLLCLTGFIAGVIVGALLGVVLSADRTAVSEAVVAVEIHRQRVADFAGDMATYCQAQADYDQAVAERKEQADNRHIWELSGALSAREADLLADGREIVEGVGALEALYPDDKEVERVVREIEDFKAALDLCTP